MVVTSTTTAYALQPRQCYSLKRGLALAKITQTNVLSCLAVFTFGRTRRLSAKGSLRSVIGPSSSKQEREFPGPKIRSCLPPIARSVPRWAAMFRNKLDILSPGPPAMLSPAHVRTTNESYVSLWRNFTCSQNSSQMLQMIVVVVRSKSGNGLGQFTLLQLAAKQAEGWPLVRARKSYLKPRHTDKTNSVYDSCDREFIWQRAGTINCAGENPAAVVLVTSWFFSRQVS